MFTSAVFWLVKNFSQFLTTVMMLVFKKSTIKLCLEEAFLSKNTHLQSNGTEICLSWLKNYTAQYNYLKKTQVLLSSNDLAFRYCVLIFVLSCLTPHLQLQRNTFTTWRLKNKVYWPFSRRSCCFELRFCFLCSSPWHLMISKEAVWRKRHKAMQIYCCLKDMGAKCQHMALDQQYGYTLSKLNEGVGLSSHLTWTTVMAATVRHQIMVAVYRCSSVKDAGKWHLWETLPPALSTCALWRRWIKRTSMCRELKTSYFY